MKYIIDSVLLKKITCLSAGILNIMKYNVDQNKQSEAIILKIKVLEGELDKIIKCIDRSEMYYDKDQECKE